MHSLARNHCLLDGNKRLAWAATRAFCILNGYDLRLKIDLAEAIVVNTAKGEYEVAELALELSSGLVYKVKRL